MEKLDIRKSKLWRLLHELEAQALDLECRKGFSPQLSAYAMSISLASKVVMNNEDEVSGYKEISLLESMLEAALELSSCSLSTKAEFFGVFTFRLRCAAGKESKVEAEYRRMQGFYKNKFNALSNYEQELNFELAAVQSKISKCRKSAECSDECKDIESLKDRRRELRFEVRSMCKRVDMHRFLLEVIERNGGVE